MKRLAMGALITGVLFLSGCMGLMHGHGGHHDRHHGERETTDVGKENGGHSH